MNSSRVCEFTVPSPFYSLFSVEISNLDGSSKIGAVFVISHVNFLIILYRKTSEYSREKILDLLFFNPISILHDIRKYYYSIKQSVQQYKNFFSQLQKYTLKLNSKL